MKKWLEGSVRRQIILWNVIVLAVLFGVLGLVVRQVARGSILGTADKELYNRIRMPLQRGFGPNGPQNPGGPDGPPNGPDVPNQARFRPGANDPNRPRRFGLDGTADDLPAFDLKALAQVKSEGLIYSTIKIEGKPYRILTAMVPQVPPHRGIMQVGYPIHDAIGAVDAIDRTLLLLIPVALILSVIGGYVLGQKMAQRVGLLSDSAQHISGGDFDARLPVQGDDEFASLAQTINALLTRQADAYREKEKLMEQQRRFVGDASHELKTPLTTIRGNIQLARQEHGLTEGVSQSLGEIDRASNDMNRLVQGLLELARADSGRLGHGKVELLVSEVLDRAAERAQAQPVTTTLADPSLTVQGNENELVRLFSNLLENARRYSSPETTIDVLVEKLGTQLKVSVRDHGPGIAPEHIAHIGERFYRVDTARARQDGGTGLGLAICKEIAQAHGGRIEFQSQIGTGTIVTVWLPISA